MSQQPPRCHYDRGLGERVTRGHVDDCPGDCRGCDPCLEPHCGVCGREHLDNAHPNTCDECVGKIREDLTDITALCAQLRNQAVSADSYGWAAAPIPGAVAMVLVGPSADPLDVRVGRHYADDHRRADPIPPLAVLASWEDRWRTWLGQEHRRRASITNAVAYFDQHLTLMAQTGMRLADHGQVQVPPDFPEFSRAIGRLRAQLEQVLHDEREPDRGVECFECGARLVRRHRDRRRCHHQTAAREALAAHLEARPAGLAWLELLAGYGLRPTTAEVNAARLPSPAEVTAARLPCPKCDQGGLVDPTPGISWECPSCRMSYSPGEYATAVRRDLLESNDGDGWTDIVLAADAASTLTGRLVPASTVRKWMDRGVVAGCCLWRAGQFWGQRLVYWPDVAERATSLRGARAS